MTALGIAHPDGVRRVETLAPEGDIHVRLTHEVDLDDLLLCIAADQPRIFERDDEDWWEGDYPTRIGWESDREVLVGRFRSMFCVCGEGHSHDIWPVDEDQNQRGSYLGVMTR